MERRERGQRAKGSKKVGKHLEALKEEATRREAMKERLELERRAVKVVERLLEDRVSHDVLLHSAKFITAANYRDTVEERFIAKMCGYPVCSNKLGKIPTQQYTISTRTNRVYDITERKCFCSNFCYKASKEFELQISETPLWLREVESLPEIRLLQKGDGGSFGEEVLLSQRRLRDEDVDNPLQDLQGSPQMSAGDIHSNSSDSEQEQEFVSQPQRARVHWADLPERTDEKKKDEQRKKQSRERLRQETKPYRETGNPEQRELSEDRGMDRWVEERELSEDRGMEERELCEDRGMEERELSEDRGMEERELSEDRGMEERELSEDRGMEERELSEDRGMEERELSEDRGMDRGVEEATVRISEWSLSETLSPTSSTQTEHAASHTAESKQSSSSTLTSKNQSGHDTDPSAQHGVSITQVGVSRRGAARLRDLLKDHAGGVQPDPVRRNLLGCLRKTLSDWCTEETLTFLYGAGHSPCSQFDGKEEEQEEEELDEDDLVDDVAGAEAGEQTRPSAPAPDYESLRKETEQLELRVREFWKGTCVLPEEEEELNTNKQARVQEQMTEDPALPLIDSQAQHLIQKRITVEKLRSCLRNMVGPLGLTMSDVSADLNDLVRTFRFTNTNIIHRTPVWTLISLVLLHLLTEVSPVVQEALKTSAQYSNTLMEELGLQEQDLLSLVRLFKSPTHSV